MTDKHAYPKHPNHSETKSPKDPKMKPKNPETPKNPDTQKLRDPKTRRPQKPIDPEAQYPRDPETQLPRDLEIQRPRNPRTQRPSFPETQKPRGSVSQRPKDPKTPKPRLYKLPENSLLLRSISVFDIPRRASGTAPPPFGKFSRDTDSRRPQATLKLFELILYLTFALYSSLRCWLLSIILLISVLINRRARNIYFGSQQYVTEVLQCCIQEMQYGG